MQAAGAELYAFPTQTQAIFRWYWLTSQPRFTAILKVRWKGNTTHHWLRSECYRCKHPWGFYLGFFFFWGLLQKMLLIFPKLFKGEEAFWFLFSFLFFFPQDCLISYLDMQVISVCTLQPAKAIMRSYPRFPLWKTVCWWYKWQLFALLSLQIWQRLLIVNMKWRSPLQYLRDWNNEAVGNAFLKCSCK